MKTSSIMLLIWLLLLSSSQKLKAEEDEPIELKMTQHSSGWVCGSEAEKKFIISVNIGEIKYEDEFYAYQVYLTYNPDKLLFVNLLDKNTLTEFFENAGKGFNVIEPGLLTAYAAQMGTTRVTGNKSLVAFEFKYIGDCPDTAQINFDDIEIEIAENFLNRLNYKDKNLIVDIKTKETEYSFVDISFLQDTVNEFDVDSLAEIFIGLNTNNLLRVDSLDFEIKYLKSDILDFTDIDLFDGGLTKMVIDSVIRTEIGDTNKINIKSHLLSNITNENVIKLKCKKIKNEADTVKLDIKISRINDCSCATSFKGDRVFVLSKVDTTIALRIKQNNDVRVCGDDDIDKKFIVTVSAGEIKDIDSLYAMQVWLTFNPEKLTFVNLIDTNTLAEFFEIKDYDLFEPGRVTAFARTMGNNQAVGDKPLIALEAKYLGDCPDTAHINFEDIELEISKNFIDRLNYNVKKLIIDVKAKETENSYVKLSVSQDTLKDFDEDSLAVAEIKLNTNGLARVDTLDFELKFINNENFEFIGIDVVDSQLLKFKIDSVYSFDDNDTSRVKIQSRVFDDIQDESTMQIKFKRLKKVDTTMRVDLNILRINDCSCATSLQGDIVYLMNKKDTSTQVVSNEIENKYIYGYYSYISDEFVIQSLQKKLNTIVLYDVMGRQVEIIENPVLNDEFRISAGKYMSGLYMFHMKLLNGIEINKVLIKN